MEANREIARLSGEITMLALLINQTTELAVFVDFPGHVGWVEISIRQSKKDYNTTLTEDRVVFHRDDAVNQLKKIKLKLRKILRDKKVDYNELDYTIREIREYHLGGTSQ
ncbi:hypothetical protein [Paenibacillus humicus]|uniref:hypothetical protein n=1 Tax=Paenibacillus humicus TaxID=412861 RepID=UPI003D2AC7DC